MCATLFFLYIFDPWSRYFRSEMLKYIWHFTHLFVPLQPKINNRIAF